MEQNKEKTPWKKGVMLKRRHQCRFIRANGERCKMESMVGEKFCVTHSQSEVAIDARARKGQLTLKSRLRMLRTQAQTAKRDESLSSSEKTRLLLSIFNKIDEYERRLVREEEERKKRYAKRAAEKKEKKSSFDERIRKAEERATS